MKRTHKATLAAAMTAMAITGGAVIVASARPTAPAPAPTAKAALYQPRATVRVVTPSEAVRLEAEARVRATAPAAHVVIDPETGAKRQMTQDEWKALHAQDRAAFDGTALQVEQLQPVALPGGAVAVELSDDFMNDLVAVKNADGTVTRGCAPKAAGAALQPTSQRAAEVK